MLQSQKNAKVKSIVQMLKDKGMPQSVMGIPVAEDEMTAEEVEPDPSGTVTATPDNSLDKLLQPIQPGRRRKPRVLGA
jgi:hypothetical protein